MICFNSLGTIGNWKHFQQMWGNGRRSQGGIRVKNRASAVCEALEERCLLSASMDSGDSNTENIIAQGILPFDLDDTIFDLLPPTADIREIEVDPLTGMVDEVTINFSEPVSGVDISDFLLTSGLDEVDLSNALLRQVDDMSYVLDLSAVDLEEGAYDLMVIPEGAGILNELGEPLGDTISEGFVIGMLLADSAPELNPIGDVTLPPGESMITIAVSGVTSTDGPLTFTAEGQSTAYVLDQELGFFSSGNLLEDYFGIGEKWIQGEAAPWYFITPAGQLFEWDGTEAATGTLVANLSPDLYENPRLLYNAPPNNSQAQITVISTSDTTANIAIKTNPGFYGDFHLDVTATDAMAISTSQDVIVTQRPITLLRDLDQQFGLTFAGDLFQNFDGRNEIWLRSVVDDVRQWFFVLPNGEMYRWDGTTDTASGVFVAQLDPSVHADPSLLYLGQNVFFDQRLGLRYAGRLYEDWGGKQERWLLDRNDQWYFVEPSGAFYQWDGSETATGAFIANLSSEVYRSLALLYNAADDLAGPPPAQIDSAFASGVEAEL